MFAQGSSLELQGVRVIRVGRNCLRGSVQNCCSCIHLGMLTVVGAAHALHGMPDGACIRI